MCFPKCCRDRKLNTIAFILAGDCTCMSHSAETWTTDADLVVVVVVVTPSEVAVVVVVVVRIVGAPVSNLVSCV